MTRSIIERQVERIQPLIQYLPEAPPLDLTPEQGEIWTTTLAALAPGWISAENYPALIAYCRHVDSANKVSHLITRFEEALDTVDPLDPLPLKQYENLSKLRARETSQANAMARSLRITNQSTKAPHVAKTSKTIPAAPDWENEE